ncbi:MAG: cupin-like domain-containing protein [Bacteroidales bacterium]|nr:cupin-like domain-containing protein [Bacteroidales bacterium]
MDLNLKIDQIPADRLTTPLFRTHYLLKSKPLIIKGYAQLFPAGKKWTFEYLKNKMGDYQIGLFDNRLKNNTAYVKPDLYMPFSEYLKLIQKDEESPLRIFLFNMFKEFPELQKDFPTPVIMKGILGKIGFAFFGGKNTTVRFHYDIDASNVLMTQIIGRKRVILVSPEYDKLLYKVPFSSFSLINPEKPDYKNFPALKYVRGYDFILQPGDALFMPSRYWHFNTYLEGGMAVSYRSLAKRPVDLYAGFMNTSLRLAFDKAMNIYLRINGWICEKKWLLTMPKLK